jgi:hypothetical protein
VETIARGKRLKSSRRLGRLTERTRCCSELIPGGAAALLERLPAVLRARGGDPHAAIRQEVPRVAAIQAAAHCQHRRHAQVSARKGQLCARVGVPNFHTYLPLIRQPFWYNVVEVLKLGTPTLSQ